MRRFALTLFTCAALGGPISARAGRDTTSPRHLGLAVHRIDTSLPRGANALQTARRALADTLAPNELAVLDEPSTSPLADGQTVLSYRQRHNGVPVVARGARVLVDDAGSARWLTAHIAPPNALATAPRLSASDARNVARRNALVGPWLEPTLAYLPVDGDLHLVWIIVGAPALPTRPVLVLDALTGGVRLRFETGSHLDRANIYPHNPVETPTLQTVTLPRDDARVGLENASIRARNCIDRGSLASVDLGGPTPSLVHACDVVPTALPDASGDFLSIMPAADTAPEDTFAELSLFYHANVAWNFAHSIGLDPKSDQPLTVIANLRLAQGFASHDASLYQNPKLPLAPYDDAFFGPADPLFTGMFGVAGDGLWFGQGKVIDFSYDGEVVYHEMGHYVVSKTAKLVGSYHRDSFGLVDSNGALNEAMADIHAAFITGDPGIGEYASQDFHVTGPLRSLDNTRQFPRDLTGEIHYDSEPISGAVWSVYAPLDTAHRVAFQKSWLTGLSMVPSGDLSFSDYAKVLTAAVHDGVDPATASALSAAFASRGILDGAPRIIDITTGAADSSSPTLGFAAPSAPSSGAVAEFAPGILQFRAIAAGTSPYHIAVEFDELPTPPSFPASTPAALAPILLLKSRAPIVFTYSPFHHDAAAVAPCSASGTRWQCLADLPQLEAGTPVYVMVANRGVDDARYDHVSARFTDGAPARIDPAPSAGHGCSYAGSTRLARMCTPFAGLVFLLSISRRARRRRARLCRHDA